VSCKERDRLVYLYLDAVAQNIEAGKAYLDMRTYQWREATKETRAVCEDALADLNRHRAEHGC